MKKNHVAAFISAIVLAGLAGPQAMASSCQSAIQDLTGEWNLKGLPTPPDHIGGIQGKGGAVIRGRDGYTTSLANYQYMAIEMNAAARACQSGDGEAALERVALVRDRLEPSR